MGLSLSELRTGSGLIIGERTLLADRSPDLGGQHIEAVMIFRLEHADQVGEPKKAISGALPPHRVDQKGETWAAT
jgi:hypothetical protein